MSDVIRVCLRSPSEFGRLYPKYDDEAGILEVKSEIRRAWPFGVDVDGRVVFDLDANRVLANVDLLIPRRRWKRTDQFPDVPRATRSADLEFCEETIKQKSFHLPLEVLTNADRTRVLIRFSHVTDGAVAIELSELCRALIDGSALLGFDIALDQGGDVPGAHWTIATATRGAP